MRADAGPHVEARGWRLVSGVSGIDAHFARPSAKWVGARVTWFCDQVTRVCALRTWPHADHAHVDVSVVRAPNPPPYRVGVVAPRGHCVCTACAPWQLSVVKHR